MSAALSDQEICRVIRDYVHENIYQYAIMLDGEWGCGKSWFVKNKVKPMFHEDRECGTYKYVYVSLYGVASVEALGKTVTGAYFAAIAPCEQKVLDILSAFGAPLSEEIPYVGKTVSVGIKQAVASFGRKIVDLKSCFFVFDDLERCCMPVTEVLGYINRLIETEECKVLVIANEKECGKSQQDARELQLIAAKMLEDYAPKMGSEPGRTHSEEELKYRKLLSIRKFRDELFGQDALYQKTKEKLIGRTLKYAPDMKKVTSILSNDALKDVPLALRRELRDQGIAAMKNEGVCNLRIYQFVLSCYAAIYPIIAGLAADECVKARVAGEVMIAVLKVAIRSRTSRKYEEWNVEWDEPEKEFKFIYCNDERYGWGYDRYLAYGFMSFRFIHEFVLDGKLDVKVVERVLTHYAKVIEPDMQRATGAFANIDKGFWEITEDELRENTREVRRLFFENRYAPQMCLRVLSTFAFYRHEFEIEYCEYEDMKAHLIEQIRLGSIKFDFDRDGAMQAEVLSGVTREKYRGLLAELKEVQQNADQDAYKEKMNLFDDANWSSILLKRVAADSGTVGFSQKRGFIRYFELDRLVEAFLAGDGNHYAIMLKVMKEAYRFGVKDFVDDMKPLIELTEKLRAAGIEDRLIARSRDVFCKHANEWIEAMKNVLEEEDMKKEGTEKDEE